ncbi:C-type lectin domain family 14 member A [Latimeria chalumnae]|uniref:C-type lectin domain family 14 member A n=1 Tax=Latimeria chalumnae TaxID=7897 RepID=UPI0003C19D91|nr:PREDICTED: C-type lectin domain family 14 member A [Latimeria chalumnae]|eukprot:XP_005989220.1 PREDICTED: C-type lectin domain family 14 member A [Latimeria chalumnae]
MCSSVFFFSFQVVFLQFVAHLITAEQTSCTNSGACYSVHFSKVNFPQAQASCEKNNGALTTMRTDQEANSIVQLLRSANESKKTDFWIGLRIKSKQCFHEDKPLRGYFWKPGDEQSDISIWLKEPPKTCLADRCVLLKKQLNELWGWEGKKCTTKHAYICKYQHDVMCPHLNTNSVKDIVFNRTTNSLDFSPPGILAKITCVANSKEVTLHCEDRNGQSNWSVPVESLCDCPDGHRKNETRNCMEIDECQQPRACEFKCVNTGASFYCACDEKHGFILAKDKKSCISEKEARMYGSSGTRSIYRDSDDSLNDGKFLPNGSHPNSSTRLPSTIEPLSERNPAPTSSSDFTTHVQNGGSNANASSNIFLPVILGILTLVILVVIVIGIFQCCFRRGSKTPSTKNGGLTATKSDLEGNNNKSDQLEKEENNYEEQNLDTSPFSKDDNDE